MTWTPEELQAASWEDLRKRVRELEAALHTQGLAMEGVRESNKKYQAELAKANASASGFAGRYSDAVARAEKAEMHLANMDEVQLDMKRKLAASEARVAELEAELQFAIDLIGPEYPGMWIAHTAREREADG